MQSVLELFTTKKVDDVINDIMKGETCVLMKPRGVKLQIGGIPTGIFNKSGKAIDHLDLMSSDLYVTPYMHIHKIRSTIRQHELYETVFNYQTHQFYLTSIKQGGFYINDYKVLHNRAELYDLTMPIVEGLDTAGLSDLLTDTEDFFKNFGGGKLSDVDAVMFLNTRYQAAVSNPHKSEPKQSSHKYNCLISELIEKRPDFLPDDMFDRFIEITRWLRKVELSDEEIPGLELPEHFTNVQDFTYSVLPLELKQEIQEQTSMIKFRMIMTIITGKGYRKDLIEPEAIDHLRVMTKGLKWDF